MLVSLRYNLSLEVNGTVVEHDVEFVCHVPAVSHVKDMLSDLTSRQAICSAAFDPEIEDNRESKPVAERGLIRTTGANTGKID